MDSIKHFFDKALQNRKSWLAVAVVAVPLSVSLALANGATPLQGIITAVWAGAFAAFFGGSNYNIFGPAGALSALVLAFASIYGAQYIPLLAIVSGGFILVIHLLRLTKYIALIPSTALHGFIIGVGITIALNQLNGALGLVWLTKHPHLMANVRESLQHLNQTNFYALGTFCIALIGLLIWKKYIKAIPWVLPISLIGIIVGYLASQWIIHLPIATLSNQFPDLAFKFFEIPALGERFTNLLHNGFLIKGLFISGFIVAIISILETIISAKIADRMIKIKSKFDQNKEVFGLGISNLASGIFGGIPSTWVLVRTAINVKSGANHRSSAVWAAFFTLIISWLCFDYFKFIPMAVISAILVNTTIGMLDIDAYKKVYHYDQRSFWIMLIVGIITFIEDPIYGILFGTALALLIYLRHASDGELMTTLFREGKFFGKRHLDDYLSMQKDGDIVICKFSGEINFICITAQLNRLTKINPHATVILSFSEIGYIDIDGIETFDELIEHFKDHKLTIYFSGIHGRLEKILQKTDFYHELFNQWKIFSSSTQALKHLGIDDRM